MRIFLNINCSSNICRAKLSVKISCCLFEFRFFVKTTLTFHFHLRHTMFSIFEHLKQHWLNSTLLYGVLLITSNFIKQPRKARKFSTRLLCSRCVSGSFCSNVKIDDLTNSNTDIKRFEFDKRVDFS